MLLPPDKVRVSPDVFWLILFAEAERNLEHKAWRSLTTYLKNPLCEGGLSNYKGLGFQIGLLFPIEGHPGIIVAKYSLRKFVSCPHDAARQSATGLNLDSFKPARALVNIMVDVLGHLCVPFWTPLVHLVGTFGSLFAPWGHCVGALVQRWAPRCKNV